MAIETFNLNDSGSTIKDNLNANFSDLDTTKADLASPAFTGNPTAPTQTAGDNSTKLATTAYVDTNAGLGLFNIYTATGTTLSLTTTAGQKVIVWAIGDFHPGTGASESTLSLKYNDVAKHEITVREADSLRRHGFALQYTETPGAATADITVTASQGSLAAVVITALVIG
jgi:hypothetical protein